MTADAHALADHAEHARAPTTHHGSGGIGNPVLGMLLFITSEVMFFAGLFAAYFSIRAGFIEVINGVPPLAADGVRRPPQPAAADRPIGRPQPDPAGHDHPRSCRRSPASWASGRSGATTAAGSSATSR